MLDKIIHRGDGSCALGFASNVIMDVPTHIYTDSEGTRYMSVSTIKGAYKNPFDKDFQSERKARENGITKEEMLAKWADNNRKSLDFANYVHHRFETGGYETETDETTDLQLKEAAVFVRQLIESMDGVGMDMWANEIMLASPFLQVAGTADLVLFTSEGKYVLFDIKTDDNLRKNYGGQKLRGSLSHLLDMPLNIYEIQLRLYGYMIEAEGFQPLIPGTVGYIFHMPRVKVKEPLQSGHGLPFKIGTPEIVEIAKPAYTAFEAMDIIDGAKELLLEDVKYSIVGFNSSADYTVLESIIWDFDKNGKPVIDETRANYVLNELSKLVDETLKYYRLLSRWHSMEIGGNF